MAYALASGGCSSSSSTSSPLESSLVCGSHLARLVRGGSGWGLALGKARPRPDRRAAVGGVKNPLTFAHNLPFVPFGEMVVLRTNGEIIATRRALGHGTPANPIDRRALEASFRTKAPRPRRPSPLATAGSASPIHAGHLHLDDLHSPLTTEDGRRSGDSAGRDGVGMAIRNASSPSASAAEQEPSQPVPERARGDSQPTSGLVTISMEERASRMFVADLSVSFFSAACGGASF
jgi:hypothetical protein